MYQIPNLAVRYLLVEFEIKNTDDRYRNFNKVNVDNVINVKTCLLPVSNLSLVRTIWEPFIGPTRSFGRHKMLIETHLKHTKILLTLSKKYRPNERVDQTFVQTI